MRTPTIRTNTLRGTMPAVVLTLFVLALDTQAARPVSAQVDSHTLLWLRFNDTLSGEQGQAPVSASGVSFEAGILGSGAYFAPGNQVFYPSSGNINASEGTLELWIKPRWTGN